MEALKTAILTLPPGVRPQVEEADRLFIATSDADLLVGCSDLEVDLSIDALRTRVAEALARLRSVERLDLVTRHNLRDGTLVYFAPDLGHWLGEEGSRAYLDFLILRECGLAGAAGYR